MSALEPKAERIEFAAVRAYLESRGWERLQTPRDDIAAYRADDEDVILAVEPTLSDYAEVMARAARTIARHEQRPVEGVLADLTHPRTDHARFRRTGQSVEDGTIDLSAAATFLTGAQRSLLAAAHQVEVPNTRFHPRMSRTAPQALLQACRLGATERGSFTLLIHCPIDLPDHPERAEFGRQTLTTLLSSLAKTVRVLRRDGVKAVVDAEEPIISANLTEAVVTMLPPDEGADLEIGATFSPVVPIVDPPALVRIERGLFASFDELASALRPPSAAREMRFVGRVSDLHGIENANDELEGEIVLTTEVEDALVRARCTLGPDDYRKAVDAHRDRQLLSVRGTLRRYGRKHVLESPTHVEVLS
ncbi:MAG: hypothetical protein KF901_07400 [Myxococcales bacterium]|nr:hypothetical protein [Myxococcales bacterium]